MSSAESQLPSSSLPNGTSEQVSPNNFPSPGTSARPFLKWAGGKTNLLSEILPRVPEAYSTYFEPFLGGGAVFFALKPERAVLSDVNLEVINAYSVVKKDLPLLVESLAKHPISKNHFYKLREQDRQSDYWVRSEVEKASRLIYLNKTCFNGLYRVNSRGEFNVPFGDYEKPRVLDEENLRRCSEALSSAELIAGDYLGVESRIAAGDFVYLDPPYAAMSETSNFASYTKDGFDIEDQRSLADFCRRIDRCGAKFLLSNSATEEMIQLYDGFRIEMVQAPRAINSKGDRRGCVSEILVRNYE